MIDVFEHSEKGHIAFTMLLKHFISNLCKNIFVFWGNCLSFSNKHTHSSETGY